MYCSSILKIIYIFYSFSLSSSLTLPLSQLYPHRLSLFLPLPFLSLNVVCSNGFDVASMGLFRCGCGLLRSVYHGSSGGSAWWAVGYGFWIFWIWVDLGVFLGIFWVDQCIMGQAPIDVALRFFWVDHRRFSGYFLG